MARKNGELIDGVGGAYDLLAVAVVPARAHAKFGGALAKERTADVPTPE